MRHFTRAEMEQAFNHFSGERLPGRGVQGIHEVSQVQRYKTGARRQIGNKVYHYAHTIGVLHPEVSAKMVYPQTTAEEILGGVAALGQMQLTCTIADTHGPALNGLLPLNHFEGGSVCVIGATTNRTFVRGIKSSTAVLVNAATATFVIQLDAPVPGPYTIADHACCLESMYHNVGPIANCVLDVSGELNPNVGMPTIETVAGDWLWLQTWGPARIAPDASVGVGGNNRNCLFGGNGAITDGDFVGHENISQIAGYVMANEVGGGQGLPFVMLMIDP